VRVNLFSVALHGPTFPTHLIGTLVNLCSCLPGVVRVCRHGLRDIVRAVGVTTVIVTHDQEEAWDIADQVVVFNKGAIEQRGTPQVGGGRCSHTAAAADARLELGLAVAGGWWLVAGNLLALVGLSRRTSSGHWFLLAARCYRCCCCRSLPRPLCLPL
jgi:hypothetical protein